MVFSCLYNPTTEFILSSETDFVIMFALDFLWHPAHLVMQVEGLLAMQEVPRQAAVT